MKALAVPATTGDPGREAGRVTERARPWVRATATLLGVLTAAKAVDLEPTWPLRQGFVGDLLVAIHEDLLFGLALGCGFAALSFLLGPVASGFGARTPRWTRWLERAVFVAFLFVGGASAAYAVIASRAYPFLWGPITYQLLALAGGARGVWSSVRGALSPIFAVALVCAPVAFVAAAWGRAWRIGASRAIPWLLDLLFVVGVLVVAQEGGERFQRQWSVRLDRPVAVSPHAAFLRSLYVDADADGNRAPRGLAYDFGERERADFLRPFPAPPPWPRAPPRGIILYVMESVGAEYLDAYGARLGLTPRFSELSRSGVLVEHAYANLGRTEGALATLLLSQYLPFTWRYFTEEHPEAKGVTLAGLLSKKGFHTAMVSAGDLTYAGQRAFARAHGFSRVLDGEELGCPLVSRWGVSDQCLVDAVLREIDADAPEPFFIIAWTNQTHHPYVAPPGEENAGVGQSDFEHYKRALAEADRQLGRLVDGLRARGKMDDVLLAVTGDHSEAFSLHHPTFAHGFHLYDEEVRIPLLFSWPRGLPPETAHGNTCSQLDVTPTLAHLAGVGEDASWFGRSIFDMRRPERAYFFASSRRLTMGVRDATFKLTVEAKDGHTELFDMRDDPYEQDNLAATRPDVVRSLGSELAAWVSVNRAAWRQGAVPLGN